MWDMPECYLHNTGKGRNEPNGYTQEDRANGNTCPRCGVWHTARSCPPNPRYDDLLSRLKEAVSKIGDLGLAEAEYQSMIQFARCLEIIRQNIPEAFEE